MPAAIQRSFAGGEIAPALHARADQVKYATGVKTMRNFIVQRFGGATNRPGTQYIAETKDSSARARLLKFAFNNDQTYIMEFGDQYIRFYRNGGQLLVSGVAAWFITTTYLVGDLKEHLGVNYYCRILHTSRESAKAITAATNANPCQVTVAGHGYATGDRVWITGVGGMTELNNLLFTITWVDVNNFTLDGVDSTLFGVYTAGGTAARSYPEREPGVGASWQDYWHALTGDIFEIPTPYPESALPTLTYSQSGDVITLTHPDYAEMALARTGHTAWTLTVVVNAPAISAPNGGTASGTAGGNHYHYKVTAISEDTYEESLPGRAAGVTITTWAAGSNPVQGTLVMHPFLTGDEVYVSGVAGMTQINNRFFTVTKTGANTFTLNGENGTTYGAGVGGTCERTHIHLSSVAAPSAATPHTVSWTPVAGALQYAVYFGNESGVFGFVGYSDTIQGATKFVYDGSVLPDYALSPPRDVQPFVGAGNYPSVSAYAKQRQWSANTNNAPETVWGSRVGIYNNLSPRFPLQADDPIEFSPVGEGVHEIRWIGEVGRMLVLTAGGEWALDGADGSGLLAADQPVNPRRFGWNGCAEVRPAVNGDTLMYVEDGGSAVRGLTFNGVSDFVQEELSTFAQHLIDNYQITSMDFAKTPHRALWAVRSDGILLGMTHVSEHEVTGWHRHDTDGVFEDVAVVSEGNESAVYVLVKRTISGATVRNVERFYSRKFTDIAVDARFVDAGLTYDGRNTTGTTLTLSGGTTWVKEEVLTLTASVAAFIAADVGNAYKLKIVASADVWVDGVKTVSVGDVTDYVRVTVVGFTSPTVVTVTAHKDVPIVFRGLTTLNWGKMVDVVTGLDHLNGKTAVALCDGNVERPATTVIGGALQLSRPYEIVHAGLPYTCDIETLELDNPTGNTIAAQKKRIGDVHVYVEETRGLFLGPDSTHLLEYPQRQNELPGEPIQPFTGKIAMGIQGSWNDQAHLFIRQSDPLPATVLAVVPVGELGG